MQTNICQLFHMDLLQLMENNVSLLCGMKKLQAPNYICKQKLSNLI